MDERGLGRVWTLSVERESEMVVKSGGEQESGNLWKTHSSGCL